MVERRTVRHVHGRKNNLGIRVDESNLAKTADYHLALSSVFVKRHGAEFLKLEQAVVLCHDRGVGCSVGCHTTGVERTESKLCTRLTDGLGGDDTHCLTLLYHLSCSEVASVALHADSVLAFAGEHRTNLDAFDWRVFYFLCHLFSDFLTGSHNEFAGCRMYDVVY